MSSEHSGKDLPGKGSMGWFGRQFGYIRCAIRSDVGLKTIYREQLIQEKPLPNAPNVRLRRTTIDEVIVKKNGTADARR